MHAEKVFVGQFCRQFHNNALRGEAKLFINYSPCCDCADELIKFKNRYPCLRIKITSAHLYNLRVYPSRYRNPEKTLELEKRSWANVEGLRNLSNCGIILQTFSGEEWNELLMLAGAEVDKQRDGYSHIKRMLQGIGESQEKAASWS